MSNTPFLRLNLVAKWDQGKQKILFFVSFIYSLILSLLSLMENYMLRNRIYAGLSFDIMQF